MIITSTIKEARRLFQASRSRRFYSLQLSCEPPPPPERKKGQNWRLKWTRSGWLPGSDSDITRPSEHALYFYT